MVACRRNGGRATGDSGEMQKGLAGPRGGMGVFEQCNFETALLTRRRQPPPSGVGSGEKHVFRQNDALKQGVFHKQHASETGVRVVAGCWHRIHAHQSNFKVTLRWWLRSAARSCGQVLAFHV